MVADTEPTQNQSESTENNPTTGIERDTASFPSIQEQSTFNLTRTTNEKELVNTLNIRDYFFFSV